MVAVVVVARAALYLVTAAWLFLTTDHVTSVGNTTVLGTISTSLAASLVQVKPRPKIQAKMTKVPFPPEFEVLSSVTTDWLQGVSLVLDMQRN